MLILSVQLFCEKRRGPFVRIPAKNNCFTIAALISFTAFAFLGIPAYAQLCTGSLGDPVVKIDFGSGTGRGAALGSSITTYTYSGSGMPMDGYYTIANTTSGMLSSWWTTTDHTGNTNGYMMVVNASAGPGVFYTKKVTGLCPGTTYEFAAWVMNLFKVTTNPNPDLTFKISTTSGTTLGSYTTGDIMANASAIVWKQYGFYFTTSNENEVVITIINNAPGAIPGNDLILDDITFRPCGPKLTVQMNGGLTSKEVCQGDHTSFAFTSSITTGYSNPSYQWQVSKDGGTSWVDIAGATGTSYTRLPTDTGAYLYRLAVAQGGNISTATCRVASNVLTINVQANPDPAASSNNPSCAGDTLRLSAASGGATYVWTGPSGFTSSLQNPVINKTTTASSGRYYVTLTTALGCSNKDSTEVSFNMAPSANAGSDVAICEGVSVTLNGSGGTTYAWEPASLVSNSNSATTIATPSDTTSYILTVSNGGCKGYDTVTVFVWKKPTANAGPDQKIYEGDVAQLSGKVGGTSVSYFWNPPYYMNNSTILDPLVTPASDFTYTLNVSSTQGCGTATDDVFIRVYKMITIPNVFSPNGDGVNDTWNITQLNTYPEAEMSVFNRYGQKVYECTGYKNEWDGRYKGKPLPVGTYYYVINLKNGLKPFSGWVMILK